MLVCVVALFCAVPVATATTENNRISKYHIQPTYSKQHCLLHRRKVQIGVTRVIIFCPGATEGKRLGTTTVGGYWPVCPDLVSQKPFRHCITAIWIDLSVVFLRVSPLHLKYWWDSYNFLLSGTHTLCIGFGTEGLSVHCYPCGSLNSFS